MGRDDRKPPKGKKLSKVKFDLFHTGNHPFSPRENVKVSQWAEQYRMVTDGHKEGPWLNSNTPYLVEPMNCWNEPSIRKIILCFAPQTGKTQRQQSQAGPLPKQSLRNGP